MSDADPAIGEDGSSEPPTVVERRSAGSLESDPTLAGDGDTAAETIARWKAAPSLDTPPFAIKTTDLATRTLLRDEILRSRALGRIGVILAIAIAAIVPFLDGSLLTTSLVLAACAVTGLANLALLYLCREPERFTPKAVAAVWLSAAPAVGLGIGFFGVFSPAPLVASLGIYFVSLGNIRWLAYAVWLIISLAIGAFALFALTGVISDPGVINADTLPLGHRAILQLLLQGLLVGVFVLGRHSRRGTAAAVAELERATRALSQREALLDEARHDLRAAIGVGGAGPWSGRELDGYHIGQLIGRGGMGEVYEALSETPGPRDGKVAIKLLTPASALDEKIVERFRREAQVTAALTSDNIVRVFAVSGPRAPIPYLVMERLAGHDLADVLRKKVVLESEALVAMVTQVAAGLDVAHAAGVVHRDVKPQNLFFNEAGARGWKILDFGVSKLGEHSGTLTAGNVVGTPSYMAPEQAQGLDDVGPSADAFSLAAIAYRCLTGRPPFRGKNIAALLYNVVHSAPVRPSSLARVSLAVDAALYLGLAKEANKRVRTAGEFAGLFADALAGRLSPDVMERARRLERDAPWSEF